MFPNCITKLKIRNKDGVHRPDIGGTATEDGGKHDH